ncbi:hypothetical protein CQ062_17815 [Ochrobactrum sp. MYb68]|nr:hypothetical protein CQ062_17815 [Ochrobactrum sp. MYb68]
MNRFGEIAGLVAIFPPRFAGSFTSVQNCLNVSIRKKCQVTRKWNLDETYIKVKGKWLYLYRVIDSNGDTIELYFNKEPDLAAAKRFIRKALAKHGRPKRTTIDGSETNRTAILQCDVENRLSQPGKPIAIRSGKYMNNIPELTIGSSSGSLSTCDALKHFIQLQLPLWVLRWRCDPQKPIRE